MKSSLIGLSLLFAIFFWQHKSIGQCLVTPPSSYSIDITVKPIGINPSAAKNPFGYNYNVVFAVSTTVSGTNTCYIAAAYPCGLSFLPMTLVNFTAKMQKNVGAIKWTPPSEKNNDFFSIIHAL